MLRYHSYNIVFQEVPGEVTLAINLSNCPNRCKGCHSPYLQEDIGGKLDQNVLNALMAKYGESITCICFMGGDVDPEEVQNLSWFIKEKTQGQIKTAWYSGKSKLPETFAVNALDYVKIGPYVEALGGLDSTTTNQRLYQVNNADLKDITNSFW